MTLADGEVQRTRSQSWFTLLLRTRMQLIDSSGPSSRLMLMKTTSTLLAWYADSGIKLSTHYCGSIPHLGLVLTATPSIVSSRHLFPSFSSIFLIPRSLDVSSELLSASALLYSEQTSA